MAKQKKTPAIQIPTGDAEIICRDFEAFCKYLVEHKAKRDPVSEALSCDSLFLLRCLKVSYPGVKRGGNRYGVWQELYLVP